MKITLAKISRGFTLVEMLVAMLILSSVITCIYSAFHAGILANRRILGEDTSTENMLGKLNIMASEIRNAVYWNNLLIVGTQTDLYFYVPMTLKDPKDVFPVYRVHYWIKKVEEKKGILYRAVTPWIAFQKPGMSPEDIPRLEKPQQWLGPLDNFTMEYAVAKKAQAVRVLQEEDETEETSSPVEGNPELIWKTSFGASSETPYGIRLQWSLFSAQGEEQKFSTLFWPALGLYQLKPSEKNVAPAGVVRVLEPRQ